MKRDATTLDDDAVRADSQTAQHAQPIESQHVKCVARGERPTPAVADPHAEIPICSVVTWALVASPVVVAGMPTSLSVQPSNTSSQRGSRRGWPEPSCVMAKTLGHVAFKAMSSECQHVSGAHIGSVRFAAVTNGAM